jgi:transcriptional regulator with PAS, ATPase and Fis domain
LCTEVSEGRFRKDLFYRLDVFPIHVPPLRERLEDIPMMVDTILERLATELQLTRVPRINRSAVEGLSRYEWPGNVRELRNVLEGALISCRGGEIGIRHLRLGQVEGTTDSQREKLASGKSLGDIVEDTQRSVIEEALRSADGKKQKAARLLGISRSSLGRLMFKLGISARN